jgi:sulfate adenylyltransferase large subunit
MATGASTADAAVILLDATKGVLPQTKRHAYIAALLGIRHVVAIVNKMDLVDYREDVFEQLEREFTVLAAQLGVAEVRCIPVSAVEGDNVVHRSKRMQWYSGPTMLEHLENVPLRDVSSESGLRLPIQYVIRPDAKFRGFAGRIASGVLRTGEAVLALPSQQIAHVKRIASFDGDLGEASEGMSVTVQLEEEIDLSRGDMLVSRSEFPAASNAFSAAIVWLHPKPMEPGREYLLKHTGKHVKARITRVRHRVNVNTLDEESASDLKMNEIALAEFSANQPLFFDAYRKNRATGSFILIDPLTNATVGAGMIREDLAGHDEAVRSFERRRAEILDGAVSRAERIARHGHRPAIISLAGGAIGAERLQRVLFNAGFQVFAVDRREVLPRERTAVAKTLLDTGFLVIFSNSEGVGELREYCAVAKVDMIESSAEEEYSELQLAEILAKAEMLRINRE